MRIETLKELIKNPLVKEHINLAVVMGESKTKKIDHIIGALEDALEEHPLDKYLDGMHKVVQEEFPEYFKEINE